MGNARKTNPPYPLFSDPNYTPDNINNPYSENDTGNVGVAAGLTRFKAPESNSTMLSDSVEMTKRLRAFVPKSSVKEGRQPINNLGYANSPEEDNIGSNYKSTFQ